MVPAGDVVERVRTLRAARTGTLLVGIDGGGGSGKSSLAALLAHRLADVTVVAVDDFSAPGVRPWEHDRLRRQVLEPLAAERPAGYERRPWWTTEPAGWVRVTPGGIVVVEGVSATRRELGDPWHLRVWVEAPEPVRLRRLERRDGPALRVRWREDWLPSERAYAREQDPRGRADLVVDGALARRWPGAGRP